MTTPPPRQTRQIPLDLGHRSAMGEADFLVAPGNQDAVAWLDAWPEWPAPVLVLFGPQGSGKSHLAQIWRARARANLLDVDDLRAEDLPDLLHPTRTAVLDGAQRVAGDPVLERALFHLYNLAKESGGHLLLLADNAPVNWVLRLPDLRSRLLAAPAVGMAAPDDSLLMAVLVKLFADRQVRVGEDVIEWLLTRTERSFANARRVVDRLDREALAEKKPITVRFCRQVLGDRGDM
ncbi:HdaA/DnaA family protein [Niveispirillum irakense]|uniref:HdaA/DnaA family protein n=1 Tax=Niveispirillum irakense TaxID=34011 RepID=UPI0004019F41|nr:DnaA/Hda family protein [Niveispirillum irakense]